MKKRLITWLAGLSVIVATASLLAGCDEMQKPPKQTEPSTQTDTNKEADTEAHVHAFGSWTVATAATCTESGTEVRTCPCGEKEERPLSALGHSFVNEVCTRCGAQYSEGLEFTSNGDGTCYVSGIGTCTDTDIRIPLVSPQGDSVTGIGAYAFRDCDGLTSINIPDSVTNICAYAFHYCKGLTSINIPDSVTSIGAYAFYNTGYYSDNSNWE
ncbi:MAG: leucine-rich repeat domain-containing protein, partial [Eubacteriales bacterium]